MVELLASIASTTNWKLNEDAFVRMVGFRICGGMIW